MKNKIVICGKMPPPYMGTSVWFDNLRKSTINDFFEVLWFNMNVHHDLSTIGKRTWNKIWANARLYFSFRRTLKEFKPRLVIIPISQTTRGFIKDSAFIRLAIKHALTMVMLHGSNLQNWYGKASPITRQYVDSAFNGLSGAIVLGEKLRYLFEPWLPPDKIFCVPNGFDIHYKNVSNQSSSRIINRYLGNLQPSKGIKELLHAAEILNGTGILAEFKITGAWRDPETRAWCEKFVKNNALPVRFEGPAYGDDKLEALVNSDIFVFTPNQPEGHPMVIIEAMAAGLPIISTDQGAITESVINGDNGFIVPSNDPEAIAEKLKMLIEDETLRDRMGKRSRELYELNFTEEKMIEKLTRAIVSTLKI